VISLFNTSVDGFELGTFNAKINNQGATLTIIKTTLNAICGGYTSKMWTHNGTWDTDSDAFVFNLENKYTPNYTRRAIYNYPSGGISFGDCILNVKNNPING
jgi:hypothetical protein